MRQLAGTGYSFGVLLCLLGLLSACGFQLRGAYQLPAIMSVTQVRAANDNSELVRSLKRSLKASDIRLVDSAQQAQAILQLSDERQQRRVISVDSRGRAREYAISYRISFQLLAPHTELQFEQQTIELQRDFLFDAEDVLGKGREEATLVRDMQQDMVRLIMLRLQAMAE
jgi:LPS-assembly lipoprotein